MQVHQKVWIHAMGSYYAGTVIKATPKRIQVRYTSGAGKTREKWATFDSATGSYINSKYERLYPVVDGTQPKPEGARSKGNGLFSDASRALAK